MDNEERTEYLKRMHELVIMKQQHKPKDEKSPLPEKEKDEKTPFKKL